VNNKFEHIEDIVAKYLAGEATVEDMALLEEWKNASPENAGEYKQLEKIFVQSSTVKQSVTVNTDAAWLKVQEKLHSGTGKLRHMPIEKNSAFTKLLRIAAMLLFVGGMSYTAYKLFITANDNVISIASLNKTQTERLPDGSSYTLNNNSALSYKENSFLKTRVVKLTGEAFFDVKHDDANPFTVEANGVLIEDVGTTFNIQAYTDKKLVIITVVTGEVRAFTTESNGISLTAGEEAVYNFETKQFEKRGAADKNISAYKDRIFIFDNTELSTVVRLLNDIYHADIKLGNANLNPCRLTATFNNEKIEDVISVISETLQLKVEKTTSSVILTGEGCN
jgi:transmembrane sensor